MLQEWLAIQPDKGAEHLFLNARGKGMTRHGFAHSLQVHAEAARQRVPSMAEKRISLHVLRRSCALHALKATRGDIRKIFIWLGHESLKTTEVYLRADPSERLNILAAGFPPEIGKS